MDIENVGEELSVILRKNDLTEIVFSSVAEVSRGVTTLTLLFKIGSSIRDKLFCKKLLYFLNELKDIPATERDKMINNIDKSEKYNVKVGEKLLYIVDSSDDHEKSRLIGIVFKSFLNKEISYDNFIDVAIIINKISIKDFNWFIAQGCRRKSKTNELSQVIISLSGAEYGEEFSLDEVRGLISSGLFEISYEPLEVEISETDDHKTLMEGVSKYSTSTYGGVFVFISPAGEVILKIFSKHYVPPDAYHKVFRSMNQWASMSTSLKRKRK